MPREKATLFGEWLLASLELLGDLSQAEFARRAGIDEAMIIRLIDGSVQNPRRESLETIMGAIDAIAAEQGYPILKEYRDAMYNAIYETDEQVERRLEHSRQFLQGFYAHLAFKQKYDERGRRIEELEKEIEGIHRASYDRIATILKRDQASRRPTPEAKRDETHGKSAKERRQSPAQNDPPSQA